MRYFNVAGPCNEVNHYMVEASTRLHVEPLIEQGQYFVIHAARQSGKTTFLQDLTKRLHQGGRYYVVYCSLEVVQGITDPEKGIPTIIQKLKSEFRYAEIPGGKAFAKDVDPCYSTMLYDSLTDFCRSLDKQLVIFFDEADCLSEMTLISFLRQLRDGYNNRMQRPFVHSLALTGVRNIRDYKARIRPDSQSLGSASPFNIVTEAMTLTNFTKEEVASLYRQHTDETGQQFEGDAVERVWEQTQGQPWLVNAIAREVIVKMLQSDHTRPVTAGMVETAIQTIILRRDTHIDSLLERLKEERVRKVIEPLILGEGNIDTLSDDFQYTRDLGLIRASRTKIEPANPIYGEVIVRTLSHMTQHTWPSAVIRTRCLVT
jgi:hypothetical protein